MAEKLSPKTADIMRERFGKDMPVSLATVADGEPQVRIVDGYYEDGAFYVITYALSDKMRQLEKHPRAAVCGEWFTGHGVGENLGYILDEKNAEIFARLREAFAGWLGNGHVDENDRNNIILKIRLTDGVLFDHGVRYDIDFT